MFLACSEILKWASRILSGKIANIVIYKGRENGGTNYDSPGPRWVPKLVIVYDWNLIRVTNYFERKTPLFNLIV